MPTEPDDVDVGVNVGVADEAAVAVGVVGAKVGGALGEGVGDRVAEGAAVGVRVDVAVGLRVGVNGIRVEVAVRTGVEEAASVTVGAALKAASSNGGSLAAVGSARREMD